MIEVLESRIAPATVFVLNDANQLLRFGSSTPETIDATIPITGIDVGAIVRGIDFRPATGELFAFTVPAGVAANALIKTYTVNPDTGEASLVGTIMNTVPGAGDNPGGFDFNPTVDRIRVVQSDNENFRINPNNGSLAGDDPNLTYTPPTSGPIIAEAYDRNFARSNATTVPTTLYGIDRGASALVVQGGINGAGPGGANGGGISLINPLGFTLDPARDAGLDIENQTGIAYAALTDNADHLTRLYTIDLTTGAATAIGLIGNGMFEARSLSLPTPTVTIVNATTATFLDADGDTVTVKLSKGTLGPADLQLRAAANGGGTLGLVNLSDDGTEFDGTNLTISVRKAATGDGLTAVGFINAAGIDLGKVVIAGDLARIDAGNTSTDNAAIGSLSVNSLGRFGSPLFSQHSVITGPVGKFSVETDVRDVFIDITGTDGTIGSLIIGGSLIGGTSADTGVIQTTGAMGAVKIGGDVLGGAGSHSGAVDSNSTIGKVTIGGSVVGGTGSNSGLIESTGQMGAVRIGGNVTGGSITGTTADLDSSGLIRANHIASVFIGGSVLTGIDSSTAGALRFNGSIVAADDIGAITIKGSLSGSIGATGDVTTAVISARGQATSSATADIAIKSLTVGGRVERANILAGYDTALAPVNADAQIGKVKVGGDWAASNIVAGIAATNAFFGDTDDAVIAGGNAGIFSRIASISIKGQVIGSSSGSDRFGFVAQQIGSFKASNFKADLTAATDAPIELSLATLDVTLREI